MKKKIIQGTIKRHPDGFGFLIPDDKEHPDVYIPHHSMKGVMSNDRVMAEVQPERGGERFRGDIVRVVTRGTKRIVGHFHELNEKMGLVRDESQSWGDDLRIPAEDSLGAKDGDLVAAEIVRYPDEGGKFTGKVVEIIGDIEDPLNDIRRVVLANNIPSEFPDDVLAEAKHFREQPDERDFQGRRDLRDKKLITIDGATAKDFDDAVLVEVEEKGFRLYVAIADVSHYVRPGTAIDREAFQRGTSVYFPNFVIPMLPEVLSNGLCSLNPHVPRLCLVAEMLFDFTGQQLSSEFYEAVMDSKARVTYGRAQEVVDGVTAPELEHVKDTILRCADLAKILMAKRFREGSLDLEIPETQLQIDGAGRPTDVMRTERLFAHRLIEELMLAANVAVATFLFGREVPALYRVHEPPKPEALAMLERYLEAFGAHARLGPDRLQKNLTKALQEFAGRPEAEIIHILTLRSMSQAKYQRNNIGHFGLGFGDYTHFTSPIRRYPDLIVHRLLKNQVMAKGDYRLMGEDDLDTAGTWLSACEQRSVKAERQVMAIKKARFMQQFLGKELDGFISSVAKFGVFVLLREYEIDGLVRVDDLGSERFEFDEEHLRLVAKRSGANFSIGDTIRIVVTAADVSSGQISFMPVATLAAKGKSAASVVEKNHRPEKRGPGKEDGSSKKGSRHREQSRNRQDSRGHSAHRNRDRGQDRNQNPELEPQRGQGRFKDRGPRRGSERHRPADRTHSSANESKGSARPWEDRRQGDRRQNDRRQQNDFRTGKPVRDAAQNSGSTSLARFVDAQKTGRKGDLARSIQASSRRNPSMGASTSGTRSTKKTGPVSQKLQFAARSKLRFNDEESLNPKDSRKEKQSARGSTPQSDRKNAEKRGPSADHRGGVRKARVSQGGGKGPSGPVPDRKAQRKRRNR